MLLWCPIVFYAFILEGESMPMVTICISLRACLGNILTEESFLVFLDFEENPHLDEKMKIERGFSYSSQTLKNTP